MHGGISVRRSSVSRQEAAAKAKAAEAKAEVAAKVKAKAADTAVAKADEKNLRDLGV